MILSDRCHASVAEGEHFKSLRVER